MGKMRLTNGDMPSKLFPSHWQRTCNPSVLSSTIHHLCDESVLRGSFPGGLHPWSSGCDLGYPPSWDGNLYSSGLSATGAVKQGEGGSLWSREELLDEQFCPGCEDKGWGSWGGRRTSWPSGELGLEDLLQAQRKSPWGQVDLLSPAWGPLHCEGPEGPSGTAAQRCSGDRWPTEEPG